MCPSPIQIKPSEIFSINKKYLTLHFQKKETKHHQCWAISDRRSAQVILHDRSLPVHSELWESRFSLVWYWKATPTVYTGKCANLCENNKPNAKRKISQTWWIYKGLYCLTSQTIKWKSLFTYSVSENICCILCPASPSDTEQSRQSGCTTPPRQHDGSHTNS